MTAVDLRDFDRSALFDGDLAPHQLTGAAFLLTHRRGLLADPVGAGKTVTTLAAAATLRAGGLTGPVLVLVDGDSLARQWRKEVAKFLPGWTAVDKTDRRLGGPKGKAQQALLDDPPDVWIVTYPLLQQRLDYFRSVEFSIAILDEQSHLKGGAVRADRATALLRDIEWAWGITATPLENHAVEVYELAAVLNLPGLWPREVFENDFLEEPAYEFARRELLRPEKIPEFRTFLADFTLRRDEEGIGLTLPTCEPLIQWVPLTDLQTWAYRKAQRGKQAPLDKYKSMDRACELVGRKGFEQSCKVEELIRLLGYGLDDPDQKVIVRATYLGVLDVAERELTRAGYRYVRIDGGSDKSERVEALEAFRDDPSVSVLLGSKVIERGLNLQFCRAVISLGCSENPQREAQLLGRVRRAGSTFHTVDFITVLSDTEHERRKLARLDEKRRRFAEVFNVGGVLA